MFHCNICGKRFTAARSRNLHEQTHYTSYECRICGRQYTRRVNLKQHIRAVHSFSQSGGQNSSAPTRSINAPPSSVANRQTQTAMNNKVQIKTFMARHRDRYDLLSFLTNIKQKVKGVIRLRARDSAVKWYIVSRVQLYREDREGNIITVEPYFRSTTYRLLTPTEFVDHDLNEAFQKVVSSLEKYIRESSGWTVKTVQSLQVYTVDYRPLSASSYIELPRTLKCSQSILNIKNDDNKCFLYSILAKLYPNVSITDRASSYIPYKKELNVKGLTFPMTLNQIERFETLNGNISVNVFGFEASEIIPLKITKHTNRQKHVNLLLISNKNTSHYCLIKNFDRFLSRTKKCHFRNFFCYYCLTGFTKRSLLTDHIPTCQVHGAQKVILPIPGKDDTVKFSDHLKSMKIPFVIYADFETIQRPIQTCENNIEISHTTPTKRLDVCCFGYKVVCSADDRYSKPTEVYRGPDAADKFIERLLEEQREIKEILKRNEPMVMTAEDEKRFSEATHCFLCGEPFLDERDKVRDHCHISSRYRNALHLLCNLLYKPPSFIPVILHGLKNFDSHIICQSLGKYTGNIKCIPQNSEKYISFSFENLRFIDSFQFLSASLDSLVENLKSDSEHIDSNFKHFFSDFDCKRDAQLLLQKNVFPYDYLDNEEKFEETKLPPIECFHSSIKNEGINQEEYAHARYVYDHLKLRNLGEWTDVYLKTDVLLLCSVFENFRDVTLREFQLDPAHFYSAPGLSWSAMLKMTKVELQLLTDVDILNFVSRGQRGGISFIGHRYAVANNPHVKNYNPSEPLSYIQLLDANNLYGWAMSQPLAKGGFRFLNNTEIQMLDVLKVPDDSQKGYLLSVDLEYPKALHDLHNDFPLAPEKKHIPNDQLSPYAQRLWLQQHASASGKIIGRCKQEKLITDLSDKKEYVVHYRNLKLYIELGMKLKTIHRVLEFDQDTWLKPYIDFNTKKRQEAKTQFEKNFYKILNCSVFGKMMENQRKYKDVKLINNEKRLKTIVAKPTFESCRIFNNNLVAAHCKNVKVTITKPVFVGQAILDLSKLVMYRFYYNYLKQRYGNTCRLLMTDTDSFLYQIKGTKSDLYLDMMDYMYLWDTSDYPPDHFLHSNVNKKTVSKFKDETNGIPIEKFCGLRSKLYVYQVKNQHDIKKAKGISKPTIQKKLYFELYEKALFENKEKIESMDLIRSHSHQLFVERVHKKCLSGFDDKRYLLPDSITSYAYGHYKINK